MKVMSFIEFINESEDAELQFIKSTAHQLIDKIRDSKKSKSREYTVFSGMEFTKPFMFDLTLYVRRDDNSNPKHDSHFSSLPWEELNFEENGYMLDASMKLNSTNMLIPKIEIHIIINPNTEPICYSKLYYSLINALAHETNHLDQTGINRDRHNVHVSSEEERKVSKKSSKYFILPEEMESNIVGMYTRSQEEDRPLDELFYDYLQPFVKSDYISRADFNKTIVSWVKKAIELYPNAKFSSKVDDIINSI
jgi:hypothetical protein